MALLQRLIRARPRSFIQGFRCYTNESPVKREKEVELPTHAQVVICGGGVIGSSTAFHLADLGVKDIILLEQGKITCGTTWHSVGLIGQVGRDDVTNCKLMQYSKNLYKSFETMGEHVGWKECGSLLLARTKDRMTMLKKKRDIAIAAGLGCDILSQREIQDKCSWIRTDDLQGGLYIPSDGALTAPDVNVAFINLAKKRGVQIFEGVGVSRVVSTKGKVSGVETTHGNIDCQFFVNCSGMWARELGRKADPPVNVPLHACEHFYITTTPIQGMDPMLPVIRDYDGLVYFREWSGGIMAGGFEPVAKLTFQHGVPPNFQFQLLQDDWDHFQILLDAIVHRIPAMETANVQKMFNGPESFTPDGNWVVGECPELENYFVAAGMGGTGIVSAGGVGKHLAEWVITGQPSSELSATNLQRFVSQHSQDWFLQERVKETLGMYTIKYPFQQRKRGRELVISPLHQVLKDKGACFIEGPNGFEIPGWFYSSLNDASPLDQYSIPAGKGSFTKPYWFEEVREEYKACKENVGVIDMSSTAKIEIQGPDATEFLHFLVFSDINQPVGSVVDTGMLYKNGTYVTECRVIHTDNNKYLLLFPASSQTRAMHWIRKNMSDNLSVTLKDVTQDNGSVKLVGPKSLQLIQSVSNVDEIVLNGASKVSVAGVEDTLVTWSNRNVMEEIDLYCPKSEIKHIYSALLETGTDVCIRNVGHYALKSLYMEDFSSPLIPSMGHLNTPLECGRDPNTLFKGVKEQNKKDKLRRFQKFLLADFDENNDIWPLGGEPIYSKGIFCGTVSTCSYCFGLESMVCSGLVTADDGRGEANDVTCSDNVDDSWSYEIAVAGRRYKAVVKQA